MRILSCGLVLISIACAATAHAQVSEDDEGPGSIYEPPPSRPAPSLPPHVLSPIPPPPAAPRYESKRRLDLMTVGICLFGGTYMPGAILGGVYGSSELAIPMVGPMVWAGKELRPSEGGFDALALGGMVMYSMVQMTGLTLAIVGAATHKKVLVPSAALADRF